MDDASRAAASGQPLQSPTTTPLSKLSTPQALGTTSAEPRPALGLRPGSAISNGLLPSNTGLQTALRVGSTFSLPRREIKFIPLNTGASATAKPLEPLAPPVIQNLGGGSSTSIAATGFTGPTLTRHDSMVISLKPGALPASTSSDAPPAVGSLSRQSSGRSIHSVSSQSSDNAIDAEPTLRAPLLRGGMPAHSSTLLTQNRPPVSDPHALSAVQRVGISLSLVGHNDDDVDSDDAPGEGIVMLSSSPKAPPQPRKQSAAAAAAGSASLVLPSDDERPLILSSNNDGGESPAPGSGDGLGDSAEWAQLSLDDFQTKLRLQGQELQAAAAGAAGGVASKYSALNLQPSLQDLGGGGKRAESAKRSMPSVGVAGISYEDDDERDILGERGGVAKKHPTSGNANNRPTALPITQEPSSARPMLFGKFDGDEDDDDDAGIYIDDDDDDGVGSEGSLEDDHSGTGGSDDRCLISETGTLRIGRHMAIREGGIQSLLHQGKELRAHSAFPATAIPGQQLTVSTKAGGGGGEGSGSGSSSSVSVTPVTRPSLRRELVQLDRLGEGSSAVVHRALHLPSLTLVAVKQVRILEPEKRAAMAREIKLLYATMVPLASIARKHLSMTMLPHVEREGGLGGTSTLSIGAASDDGAGSHVQSPLGASLLLSGSLTLPSTYQPEPLPPKPVSAAATPQFTGHGHAAQSILLSSSTTPSTSSSSSSSVAGMDHIVRLYDAHVNPGAASVSIVMEYMGGGSLQEIVDWGGLQDEPALARVAAHMLRGLAFLHSAHQLHRDIKPGNVLADTGGATFKCADFGIARQLEGTQAYARTWVGTMVYMSPERLGSSEEGYSYPSDVWSTGLTLLALAAGRFPYAETSYWDMLNAVRSKPAPLDVLAPAWERAFPDAPARAKPSPELLAFLGSALAQDPRQRGTALQLLQHPFITKHCSVVAEGGGGYDLMRCDVGIPLAAAPTFIRRASSLPAPSASAALSSPGSLPFFLCSDGEREVFISRLRALARGVLETHWEEYCRLFRRHKHKHRKKYSYTLDETAFTTLLLQSQQAAGGSGGGGFLGGVGSPPSRPASRPSSRQLPPNILETAAAAAASSASTPSFRELSLSTSDVSPLARQLGMPPDAVAAVFNDVINERCVAMQLAAQGTVVGSADVVTSSSSSGPVGAASALPGLSRAASFRSGRASVRMAGPLLEALHEASGGAGGEDAEEGTPHPAPPSSTTSDITELRPSISVGGLASSSVGGGSASSVGGSASSSSSSADSVGREPVRTAAPAPTAPVGPRRPLLTVQVPAPTPSRTPSSAASAQSTPLQPQQALQTPLQPQFVAGSGRAAVLVSSGTPLAVPSSSSSSSNSGTRGSSTPGQALLASGLPSVRRPPLSTPSGGSGEVARARLGDGEHTVIIPELPSARGSGPGSLARPSPAGRSSASGGGGGPSSLMTPTTARPVLAPASSVRGMSTPSGLPSGAAATRSLSSSPSPAQPPRPAPPVATLVVQVGATPPAAQPKPSPVVPTPGPRSSSLHN